MNKFLYVASCLMLSACTAIGAGFQLNVQGIRQIAMAGSGTAYVWDASTIFYNPAGLSRLSSVQAYGSVQFLIPRTQYAAPAGYGDYKQDSEGGVYTPFNVYVGGPLKQGSKWGLGLGVYTPFGSGMKWDDGWRGRYVVQSISLLSIFIQPTVSYKINETFSVGGGFIYGFGNLKLKRAVPLQNSIGQEGQGELKGSANGVGFNLGLQVKASEQWQFGLTYRSQVKMKVKEGDATFTVPASVASNFPNTTFTASVPLPQVASLGIGYQPTSKLRLQLDLNYVGWSSYDTLKFDYKENTAILADTRAPREYEDKLAIRLGGHYQLNNAWALMVGTAYDPSPVKDGLVSPDLPDADRWLLTGGFTVKPTSKLSILAGIEYGASAKREATYTPDNFNGTYQTKALVPSIGVTYDF